MGAGSFDSKENIVRGLTLNPTAARSTAALESPEGHRRTAFVLPSQRGQCRWRPEGRRYPPRTSTTPGSTTAPTTTPTEMTALSTTNPMPLLAGLDLNSFLYFNGLCSYFLGARSWKCLSTKSCFSYIKCSLSYHNYQYYPSASS